MTSRRGLSKEKKEEVRVYCCRIYDRVLSDEEAAWNFAIDKKRGFGL